MNDPFGDLRLSNKTRNYLKHAELETVGELLEAFGRGLPVVKGYGAKTRVELADAVQILARQVAGGEISDQLSLFPSNKARTTVSPLTHAQRPFSVMLLLQPAELGLSARAVNALREGGVHLVGDLASMTKPDLRRMGGLGSLSILEIERALADADLQLASAFDGWPLPNLAAKLREHARELEALRTARFEQLLAETLPRKATLEGEFELIGLLAGSERNAGIVLSYLGFRRARPSTLTEAGQPFGLTRERVRQIVSAVVHELRARVLRPQRLITAMRALRRAAPVDVAAADEVVGRAVRTDGGATAACILRTVEVLTGRRQRLKRFNVGGSCFLLDERMSRVVQRVISDVRKRVAAKGVVRTRHVNAILTNRLQRRVLPGFVTALLDGLAGRVWLDPSNEWFTLGGPRRNRLANLVQKVLAVSPAIDLRALREGVRRNYYMNGFAPPTEVLGKCIESLGWAELRGSTVHSKSPLELEQVFGATAEAKVVQCLMNHGPVLTGAELIELATSAGCADVSVNHALCYSAVLQRVKFGIYALRGASFEPSDLERAMARATRQGGRMIDYGWGADRTMWLMQKLSTSTVRTGICGLPASLSRVLKGDFTVNVEPLGEVGTATCSDGRLWGVRSVLRRMGAAPGEFLLLEFDPRAQRVVAVCGTEELVWAKLEASGAPAAQ